MTKERRKVLLPLLFFPIIIILWKAYIALFNVPDYLLPQPEALLQTTIYWLREICYIIFISL